MSKRTNSCVWSYFTAEEGTPYAVCNTCDARLKRGNDGERSTWSSTPLWSHLQKRHPPQYHEAQAAKKTGEEHQKRRRIGEMDERKKIYVSGTPKLLDFVAAKAKYSPDSPEQKELSKLLSIWVADGVLPYGVVDNER